MIERICKVKGVKSVFYSNEERLLNKEFNYVRYKL